MGRREEEAAVRALLSYVSRILGMEALDREKGNEWIMIGWTSDPEMG